jgi:hypothetical protein
MCLACIMEVVIKIKGCSVDIHELHYPSSKAMVKIFSFTMR